MSYAKVEQIEKGAIGRYIGNGARKFAKKSRTRRIRRANDPRDVKYKGWIM